MEKTREKARITFLIPKALVDEIRDAVIFLAGHPHRLTMAQLAEDALRAHVTKLKREFNHGKSFPKNTGRPKTGRPVGV